MRHMAPWRKAPSRPEMVAGSVAKQTTHVIAGFPLIPLGGVLYSAGDPTLGHTLFAWREALNKIERSNTAVSCHAVAEEDPVSSDIPYFSKRR